jgi:RNA polymerase sigma-70 factor (ECF subfamily)
MNSDWDLLTKAKNGDEKACVFIVSKYNKSLIRIAALITGSIDAAKDVVQETFYRLINTRIKHQEGNFKSYLTTIAYRLALKEKYRVNKNRSIIEYDFEDHSLSAIEKHINEETQKNVFNAIYSLNPDHRDILVLRFYGEHSYEEIAHITQIPIGTVKSRIFYAVKACSEKLKGKGVLE